LHSEINVLETLVEFQDGPAYANARPPYVARLTRGKWVRHDPARLWPRDEPSVGNDDHERWTRVGSVDRYPVAMLCRHLYTWTHWTEPGHRHSASGSSRRRNWLNPLSYLACVGDDSFRSIENTLQLVGCLWRTDQETATAVDTVGDRRTSGRE